MSKVTISVKLPYDYSNVQILVSTSQDLANPIYSALYTTMNRIAKITLSNLQQNTQYYYGTIVGGILLSNGNGSFKTFPNVASSFTCAFSSCSPTVYNGSVFDTIRNSNPLFFIHMGDLHYSDITTNNISLFRDAYDTVFSSSRQANLYANIPTMYMFDDHDFSNNDSDGTSNSKPACQQAYKEFVPHYPLNTADGGCGQSWVVGRVRFIMPDLMSYKSPMELTDDANKKHFGDAQLQWFYDELTKPEPVKVWVNVKPWVGTPAEHGLPSDKWWGYTYERTMIANFIKNNNLQGRVMILSGDTHSIAIDNGTNGDYATGGGGGIPVFQAAPLGSHPSLKGGAYSEGAYTNTSNGNQYGVMNITDDGSAGNITAEWIGKRGAETLVTYTMSIPSSPYVKP